MQCEPNYKNEHIKELLGPLLKKLENLQSINGFMLISSDGEDELATTYLPEGLPGHKPTIMIMAATEYNAARTQFKELTHKDSPLFVKVDAADGSCTYFTGSEKYVLLVDAKCADGELEKKLSEIANELPNLPD